jgi:hypothetical protein
MYLDFSSAEYRLNSMIVDTFHHSFFISAGYRYPSAILPPVFKAKVCYIKGIVAVNLSNVE